MTPDDTKTLMTQIAYHGIFADAFFASRMIPAMGAPEYGGYIPLLLSPWWSLYIHEARPIIQSRVPELDVTMSSEAEHTFAHARHGTKMFLDTKRSISEYEDYFANVASIQVRLFARQTLRPLQRLTTDLGLIKYRDRVIISTHGTTFSMNIDPSEVLDPELGAKLKDLWTEAGAFFGVVLQGEAGPVPAIVNDWKADSFSHQDVRSEKYYTTIFNGSDSPHLNAVLLHFTAMINSVDLLFPLTTDLKIDTYVLFKIRYILTYHILESLKKLSSEMRSLSPASDGHLSFLVDGAPLVPSMQNAWLRNLLVHYIPSKRADLALYQPEDLLQSAVAMTANANFSALVKETNELLAHLVTGLNLWMTAPKSR
ncbi:hypothetical protein ACMT9Y_09340 [Clavibacter tessellarius]|uniref:hypothetical protein n=1 Tax=Clavibacter tessellarius TaxID=31965 RepID=UPI0039E7F97A